MLDGMYLHKWFNIKGFDPLSARILYVENMPTENPFPHKPRNIFFPSEASHSLHKIYSKFII